MNGLAAAEKACMWLGSASRALCLLAGLILLLAMGFATCVDIVLRQFGAGIPGIWEAVTLAMRWMIGLALPYAFYSGSHIVVELFTDGLPPRWRQGVIVLALLVTLATMTLLAWKVTGRMLDIRGYGGVTSDLNLPSYYDWVPLALGPILSVPVLLALVWREIIRLFTGDVPSPESQQPGEPA